MKIKVKYDGKYPALCFGKLTVIINGKIWNFPENCLISGGEAYFTDNTYFDPEVSQGAWSIEEWPKGFPEEYKERVIEEINSTVPWGCCGGCL